MTKCVGALFLVLAGLFMGQGVLRRRTGHIRELENLASALFLLSAEIAVHLSPMETALTVTAREAAPEVRPFFRGVSEGLAALGARSFGEIWAETAAEMFPRLTPRELRWLSEPGGSLGSYDSTAQARALERCIGQLRQEAARLQEELERNRKLWPGLGAGAAALLAVLLI